MKKSLLLILTILSFGYAYSQTTCQSSFTFQSSPGTNTVYLQGYASGFDSLPITVTSWTWTVSNAFTLTGQNPSFQANASGTYYICLTIQTTGNCTSSYCDTVIVGTSNPCNLYVAGSVSNATTSSSNDGSVDITTYYGTAPYVYSWNNGAATEDLTNLAPGLYEVTVADANGCTASQYFSVNSLDSIQPDSLLQIWVSTSNTSGVGQCDGTAYIYVYGGTPPYQYYFANSTQSGDSLTNLCAGTYSVVVTDANGFSETYTFTISDSTIPADSLLFVNINSGYSPNGSTCMAYAEADVWGGTAPYTYFWSNAAASQFIQGLCPGFYCVTVTDATGQNASACISIMNYDSTYVYPQDTTSSTIDTCFTTMIIDSAYVAGVNTTNTGVFVNWVLLVNGDTIYINQQYVISTPGSYLITLIINCNGAKSIFSLSDIYVVTPEDLAITGINKLNSEVFTSLYPNPVKDMLFINSAIPVTNASIIDATGRTIATIDNKKLINVKHLNAGVYFIKINFSNNTSAIKKFIK